MPGGGVPLQRQIFIFAHSGGDIPGNVHHHGAGAAAAGQYERLPHGVRQLGYIPHKIGGFCDGHGDAGDVHLLKGVLSDEVLRHIAGDKNYRGGIHVCRGNAGGEVRGAGAGGCKAHTHLAGAAGITVRGVGRALLVGGENMGDLPMVIEGIIYVENGAAGIAEHGIHVLFQQTFDQYLRACEFHVNYLLKWV